MGFKLTEGKEVTSGGVCRSAAIVIEYKLDLTLRRMIRVAMYCTLRCSFKRNYYCFHFESSNNIVYCINHYGYFNSTSHTLKAMENSTVASNS